VSHERVQVNTRTEHKQLEIGQKSRRRSNLVVVRVVTDGMYCSRWQAVTAGTQAWHTPRLHNI